MPLPSNPARIVENPAPLNPASFPFAILPFPALFLLQSAGFNTAADKQPSASAEPGQH